LEILVLYPTELQVDVISQAGLEPATSHSDYEVTNFCATAYENLKLDAKPEPASGDLQVMGLGRRYFSIFAIKFVD
jgi:hypothetical protein